MELKFSETGAMAMAKNNSCLFFKNLEHVFALVCHLHFALGSRFSHHQPSVDRGVTDGIRGAQKRIDDKHRV